MLNGRLSFDLETIPTEEHARRCLAAEYDPSTFKVQHGAKDPEKIATQQLAHQADHLLRCREDAARGSLSGMTGRIACWGWATGREAHSTIVLSEMQEAQAVGEIIAALRENALSTWNGRGFDLPFLLLRAAILGVPIPRGMQKGWFQRWETAEHFDGYAALKWKTNEMWSLERAAKALGIEPLSVGNGGEIAALFAAGDYESIRAKNLQDVRRTLRVNAILEEAFGL